MSSEDSKLRFLFAMFQGGGNVPLIMPIVSELVSRGHEVRILAGPGIRPVARSGRVGDSIDRGARPVSEGFLRRITDSGATFVPLSEPPTNPYVTAPPLRGLLFGWMPTRFVPIASSHARTTLWSSVWASNLIEQVRQTPVDAVVADYWLLGALAGAEAVGVPRAVIVHNAFPPNAAGQPPKGSGLLPARSPLARLRQALWQWAYVRVWLRDGLPAHNRARAEVGLTPLRSPFHEYDRAARVLVTGIESFDFPARLAQNVRYVGVPIDDKGVERDAWPSPWPADDVRPLVLVSLSTLDQGQVPVMHRVLEAVGTIQARALVTLGPSLSQAEFRRPPNVVFEAFVPHSAVLPNVAAMVSQCGLGTLSKALMHGVPLVCVPLVGDQPDNAARIAARGAGIRLSPDASAEIISTAISKVLEEPSYREAARRVGRELAQATPEITAANELEAVARGF
jgi:UDP:flavonoid glycosyltransferase YjiC (YdhE family)